VNKWAIAKHELSRSVTKTFAAHHGAYFVTILVEPLHKNHARPQASICCCNFRKLSVASDHNFGTLLLSCGYCF